MVEVGILDAVPVDLADVEVGGDLRDVLRGDPVGGAPDYFWQSLGRCTLLREIRYCFCSCSYLLLSLWRLIRHGKWD